MKGCSMTDEHTPKQFNKPRDRKNYEPPSFHVVQMRTDRFGLKYPSPLGTARPDREGYGDLLKMQANTISGFSNIMTDPKLKEIQANYRKDRREKEREEDRGRE